MLAAQRRQLILEAVRTGSGVGVVELAQRFDVSEMTVRRDLAQLRARGQAHARARRRRQRARGAAVRRDRRRAARPRRSGSAGPPPSLVLDGQTIMIDIGTTTLQLARHLHGRQLTVITSNLAVIEELLPERGDRARRRSAAIVRRNYRSLVGVLAEDALRQLSADVVFLGASGIRDDLSVMDTHDGRGADQARDDRRAPSAPCCSSTRRSSRWAASCAICGAEELDVVVTDARPRRAGPRRVPQAGVEVVNA